MTCRSERQAPAPPTLSTTCPGPASGSGTSTSSGTDCHLVWRSARIAVPPGEWAGLRPLTRIETQKLGTVGGSVVWTTPARQPWPGAPASPPGRSRRRRSRPHLGAVEPDPALGDDLEDDPARRVEVRGEGGRLLRVVRPQPGGERRVEPGLGGVVVVDDAGALVGERLAHRDARALRGDRDAHPGVGAHRGD